MRRVGKALIDVQRWLLLVYNCPWGPPRNRDGSIGEPVIKSCVPEFHSGSSLFGRSVMLALCLCEMYQEVNNFPLRLFNLRCVHWTSSTGQCHATTAIPSSMSLNTHHRPEPQRAGYSRLRPPNSSPLVAAAAAAVMC